MFNIVKRREAGSISVNKPHSCNQVSLIQHDNVDIGAEVFHVHLE